MDWLREYISDRMTEWNVPGLAIALVKENEVIFEEGFGWRDADKKLPVTPKTLFAIASCSKAFTTTSIGILIDREKLDWDRPVRDYLPTFKLYDAYASANITLRDLVTHRSGLPRHDLLWYDTQFSRQELIERLPYLESSQQLRTKYQYQNLMYVTAGYLVEQVTDSSWEKFVRKEIFSPLKMNDSNFSVIQSQQRDNFALPYQKRSDRIERIPFLNIDAIAPAGSINSNISDLSKWLIFNLNKGKFNNNQIISETNLKQIHTPQIIISDRFVEYDEVWYESYGLGWFIYPYRGHHVIEHGGNIDGFSALTLLLPQEKIGMIIITNLEQTRLPTTIAYQICDRLLGLEEIDWNQRFKTAEIKNKAEKQTKEQKRKSDRQEGTHPSHPLQDYAGDYEHPGYGRITIELKEEKLLLIFHSIIFTIEHYHYDIFEGRSEYLDETKLISFQLDLQGNITSLSISLEPEVKDILFKKSTSFKEFLIS
jgi:CubicO group peptidase (beta-lactamase class C family)